MTPPDELVERVARSIWMADAEPYDPADRIPFEEAFETHQAQCRAEARAAIAVALEEAAKVAEAHSWRVDDPGAAAIRDLKEKNNV